MGLEAFLFDNAAMRDFLVQGYCVLSHTTHWCPITTRESTF